MKTYYFSTAENSNVFMTATNLETRPILRHVAPSFGIHIACDALVREGADEIVRQKFLKEMDDVYCLACSIYHKPIRKEDLRIVVDNSDS